MSSDGFSISNFRVKFFTRENRCFNYVATAFELTLETLILLVVTLGLSALLLFLVNMCWGMPLTFIVSAYFYRWPIYTVDRWGAAYILYFAPTLCVYGLCFKITNRLLPEIGTVIKAFSKATRFIIARVRSADDEAPIVPAQPAHPDPPPQADPVA